jgi:hypothetical protein
MRNAASVRFTWMCQPVMSSAPFDMAANERLTIAGSHLPFPGIGHVAKAATGYAYVRSNGRGPVIIPAGP